MKSSLVLLEGILEDTFRFVGFHSTNFGLSLGAVIDYILWVAVPSRPIFRVFYPSLFAKKQNDVQNSILPDSGSLISPNSNEVKQLVLPLILRLLACSERIKVISRTFLSRPTYRKDNEINTLGTKRVRSEPEDVTNESLTLSISEQVILDISALMSSQGSLTDDAISHLFDVMIAPSSEWQLQVLGFPHISIQHQHDYALQQVCASNGDGVPWSNLHVKGRIHLAIEHNFHMVKTLHVVHYDDVTIQKRVFLTALTPQTSLLDAARVGIKGPMSWDGINKLLDVAEDRRFIYGCLWSMLNYNPKQLSFCHNGFVSPLTRPIRPFPAFICLVDMQADAMRCIINSSQRFVLSSDIISGCAKSFFAHAVSVRGSRDISSSNGVVHDPSLIPSLLMPVAFGKRFREGFMIQCQAWGMINMSFQVGKKQLSDAVKGEEADEICSIAESSKEETIGGVDLKSRSICMMGQDPRAFNYFNARSPLEIEDLKANLQYIPTDTREYCYTSMLRHAVTTDPVPTTSIIPSRMQKIVNSLFMKGMQALDDRLKIGFYRTIGTKERILIIQNPNAEVERAALIEGLLVIPKTSNNPSVTRTLTEQGQKAPECTREWIFQKLDESSFVCCGRKVLAIDLLLPFISRRCLVKKINEMCEVGLLHKCGVHTTKTNRVIGMFYAAENSAPFLEEELLPAANAIYLQLNSKRQVVPRHMSELSTQLEEGNSHKGSSEHKKERFHRLRDVQLQLEKGFQRVRLGNSRMVSRIKPDSFMRAFYCCINGLDLCIKRRALRLNMELVHQAVLLIVNSEYFPQRYSAENCTVMITALELMNTMTLGTYCSCIGFDGPLGSYFRSNSEIEWGTQLQFLRPPIFIRALSSHALAQLKRVLLDVVDSGAIRCEFMTQPLISTSILGTSNLDKLHITVSLAEIDGVDIVRSIEEMRTNCAEKGAKLAVNINKMLKRTAEVFWKADRGFEEPRVPHHWRDAFMVMRKILENSAMNLVSADLSPELEERLLARLLQFPSPTQCFTLARMCRVDSLATVNYFYIHRGWKYRQYRSDDMKEKGNIKEVLKNNAVLNVQQCASDSFLEKSVNTVLHRKLQSMIQKICDNLNHAFSHGGVFFDYSLRLAAARGMQSKKLTALYSVIDAIVKSVRKSSGIKEGDMQFFLLSEIASKLTRELTQLWREQNKTISDAFFFSAIPRLFDTIINPSKLFLDNAEFSSFSPAARTNRYSIPRELTRREREVIEYVRMIVFSDDNHCGKEVVSRYIASLGHHDMSCISSLPFIRAITREDKRAQKRRVVLAYRSGLVLQLKHTAAFIPSRYVLSCFLPQKGYCEAVVKSRSKGRRLRNQNTNVLSTSVSRFRRNITAGIMHAVAWWVLNVSQTRTDASSFTFVASENSDEIQSRGLNPLIVNETDIDPAHSFLSVEFEEFPEGSKLLEAGSEDAYRQQIPIPRTMLSRLSSDSFVRHVAERECSFQKVPEEVVKSAVAALESVDRFVPMAGFSSCSESTAEALKKQPARLFNSEGYKTNEFLFAGLESSSDDCNLCLPQISEGIKFNALRHADGTPHLFLIRGLVSKVFDVILDSPGITRQVLVKKISISSDCAIESTHVDLITKHLELCGYISSKKQLPVLKGVLRAEVSPLSLPYGVGFVHQEIVYFPTYIDNVSPYSSTWTPHPVVDI